MKGSFGILSPGSWLVQDQNAFELGLMAERGCVEANKWEPQNKAVGGFRSILIIRSGAIGDLLFLSPCIEPLRAKYPGAKITLCCFRKHWLIMYDAVGEFVEYPLNADLIGDFDLIIPLENVIETSAIHATDAFAEALGVKVTDYKPVYKVTEEEKAAAQKNFPRQVNGANYAKRVMLHLRASTRNRDYPFPLWAEVIKSLRDSNHEVFLTAGKGQIPQFKPDPYVHDLSSLSWRDCAAVLSTCNAFAGVDSSFIHCCHALDIPAVGLFAAFPWQIRTGKAPLTRVIQSAGDCAPCHWLAKGGSHFPPDGPCARSGFCEVLAAIKPEIIISALNKILT